MLCTVKIYSEISGEIEKFLKLFYNKENINLENQLFWKNSFENPIEIINITSTFIDNKDNFKANMWISLDKDIFINVTETNINELIKYIYERFPDI